jgi:hypothetical protein
MKEVLWHKGNAAPGRLGDQAGMVAGGNAPVGAAARAGVGPAMDVGDMNPDHFGHRVGAAALADDMGRRIEHGGQAAKADSRLQGLFCVFRKNNNISRYFR